MFKLYTPDGKEMSFYVKDCAEVFQVVFGGIIVNEEPAVLRFRSKKWQPDSYPPGQKLQLEMEEEELY